MKKIAYLLAYIGAILTLGISILELLVGYSYYLNQPTNLSQASIWVNLFIVMLNFLLITLIYKMNFDNTMSSIILIAFSLIIVILPGLTEYLIKYYYYPQYSDFTYINLLKQALYQGIELFPIILVVIASVVFIIRNIYKK